MLDFSLNDEQRQYRQLALDFAKGEIAPRAAKLDERQEFPLEICRAASESGLLHLTLPERYGGPGLSLFDACLISEELASECSGVALVLIASALAYHAVMFAGTEEQKRYWLPLLNDGVKFAALCGVGEAHELRNQVSFKKFGSDYVLNGLVKSVANAPQSDWFVVSARADDGRWSNFLLENHTRGVTVGEKEITVGQRALHLAPVSFDDVRLPADRLLGELGEGLALYERALASVRPLLASLCVGLARAALRYALAYSKERTTFGVSISNHQAVAFMLADMAKDIDAARLLIWQAARIFDLKSALEPTYAARAFAADMAMRVAIDAVQIYGGYGYSREYPVEKLMRDAKMLQIFETSSIFDKKCAGRIVVGV